MNIDLELYRIFYVVANYGNITKASLALNISQPAISKAIKNLEVSLGGNLFIRTKRGVILTQEGEEFFKFIKQAMEYITNAENKFTDLINLETGTIKIGISATLTKEFLLPYLAKFHELYPHIKIEISTLVTKELIPKLRNGLIDLIILNLNGDSYGNDIKLTPIKKVQDVFVVGPKYKDLAKKELSLKDLNNYSLILQAKTSNTRTFIDNICKDYNVILKPNMELASYSLVTEFTKIGLGIGYVTKEFITKDLENKDLYILNIKENIPSRYIGMATSTINSPNFSTKKLIEIINNKK